MPRSIRNGNASAGRTSIPPDGKPTSAQSPTGTVSPLTKPAGTIIDGRYEIQSLIGIGGMSAVYRVHYAQLDRTVALKMLHPHLLQQRTNLERFLQEARAESSLKHPNVVSVQAMGATEEGHLYMVMDYLEGQSLAGLIESTGRIEANEAVEIFLQICSGLQAAHDAGIVHRDLKPSNVVLVGTPPNRVAKIVDFGIAKLFKIDGEEAQKLTSAGSILGSPTYMSPEQCQGKSLDHRSDIYSLGCMMYEVLVGRAPFEADSTLETMCKHLENTAASFAEVAPDVVISADLEAVAQKALQKDPMKRFQTVCEMIDALHSVDLNIAEQRKNKNTSVKKRLFEFRARQVRKILPLVAVLVLVAAGLLFLTVPGRILQLQLVLIATNSASDKITLLHELSSEYLRAGDYKQAAKYALLELENTQGLDRSDPTTMFLSHIHLADLYWQSGNRSAAGLQYAEALASIASSMGAAKFKDDVVTAGIEIAVKRADGGEPGRLLRPLVQIGTNVRHSDSRLTSLCFQRVLQLSRGSLRTSSPAAVLGPLQAAYVWFGRYAATSPTDFKDIACILSAQYGRSGDTIKSGQVLKEATCKLANVESAHASRQRHFERIPCLLAQLELVQQENYPDANQAVFYCLSLGNAYCFVDDFAQAEQHYMNVLRLPKVTDDQLRHAAHGEFACFNHAARLYSRSDLANCGLRVWAILSAMKEPRIDDFRLAGAVANGLAIRRDPYAWTALHQQGPTYLKALSKHCKNSEAKAEIKRAVDLATR